MGNGFTLFFSAILAFCAVILGIIACAGSTSNYVPINKIYAAQLDLQNISISNVFPSAGSTVSSLSELGLPDYLNIGLWSYCTEYSNGTVGMCTEAKGIQTFDLKTILYDNIENNEVVDLITNITNIVLPDEVQDKMSYYNDIVKAMFITLLIGICVTFLSLVVNIVRWIIHASFLNWVGRFLALIGFLGLIISAGTSLGCYLYIKHLLKDNYDTAGVSLSVGSVFQGILWGAVFSSLLGFILWCCVRQRRNITYVSHVEEKPLIV